MFLRRGPLNFLISIHAPREGGDGGLGFYRYLVEDFNPRPPRGGRRLVPFAFRKFLQISIHAPREGGDLVPFAFRKFLQISIHAPREGGDDSTTNQQNAHSISIHAPREGGDCFV